MSLAIPHFLLQAETALCAAGPADDRPDAGRWRFILRGAAGGTALEAADEEPAASSERLELLAIIRGLEALDQPSRVTLVAVSPNIQAGLRFGLAHWRANDWQWERYGQLTAVKNADLWQRLDRLLEIHSVQCRPARKAADDLCPPRPAWKQLRDGRRIRVDRKHEARSRAQPRSGGRHETNSKERMSQTKRRPARLKHSNFLLSNLFRISDFVLRAFGPSS
jgi:ribonuclease HI